MSGVGRGHNRLCSGQGLGVSGGTPRHLSVKARWTRVIIASGVMKLFLVIPACLQEANAESYSIWFNGVASRIRSAQLRTHDLVA